MEVISRIQQKTGANQERMIQMKKSLAILCALALCLGLATPAFAGVVDYGAEIKLEEKTYTQTFSDVPESHWVFRYIAELVERGAINGYPDGKFYPQQKCDAGGIFQDQGGGSRSNGQTCCCF